MPTRGYIAGKPVSRWEADSDNIDIEYKNLDHARPPTGACTECFAGRKGQVLRILLVTVIFFVGLILGYIIRRNIHEKLIMPKLNKHEGVQQDYDIKVSEQLRARVLHVDNYADNMKVITSEVMLSGMGNIIGKIEYVKKFWKYYKFDSVKIKQYSVQLSYPSYIFQSDNQVTIMNENKTIIFKSHNNVSNTQVIYQPFNAYAHSGDVLADLVYGHYGRQEDFDKLEKLGVALNGTIALIRYGRIHAANKVRHAEERGILGVILYCDPADYTDPDSYVDSAYWLQNWAIHLSQVRYSLVGDPTTPQYSAVDGVHHIADSNSSLPTIPVLPVSYSDAETLMAHMDGVTTPSNWVGGMNITYNTGPGYLEPRTSYKVRLKVTNELVRRDVHNIVASIRGKYEEDQYVIVGAHIDTWTQGAIDAGTGFSVIMDVARTFSDQIRLEGWRPRRSIIFAIWDASKFGHIGTFEWIQEYEKQLSGGVVAYINLDAAIRGNYSFFAQSSPSLHDVIYNATRRVDLWGSPVYDQWLQNIPDPESADKPWIQGLCGDSDHSPFIHHLGVPSMSPAFTYNIKKYPNLPTYPVYSTLEDTMDYFSKYIDHDYNYTMALTQIVTDMVLQLADSAILPLNITNYIPLLEQGSKNLKQYETDFQNAGITLAGSHLFSAVSDFTASVKWFAKSYYSLNKNKISEFDLHRLNHQVIELSRAFISETGLPGLPQYRNLLISPHPENLKEETIFPGIIAGILEGRKTGSWIVLKEHVTLLTIALQRGSDILTDDLLMGS
ncbi:putative N-acetylated-alpha-linked acidic dipeptidase isoform X2 [Gigantopelta aegis]|nr:putative N-acetylated-alpha-linked acidic dipeptidase isoform X2 [Gigantopelta aegis]